MRERASVEFDVGGPDDTSHFRGKAHPLADAGLAVYVRDVTERLHAEQALRALEGLKAAQLERDRLARDLHDSVSQALFAANLKAEALGLTLEHDEKASALVGQLQRLRVGQRPSQFASGGVCVAMPLTTRVARDASPGTRRRECLRPRARTGRREAA